MVRAFFIASLCLSSALSAVTLDLETALERAYAYSPDLKAAAAEVGIKGGERLQASLLPNPDFSFTAEDFGGNKQHQAFDQTEYTYVLTQSIDAWGKRRARTAVVSYEKLAAECHYLAVLTEVRHAVVSAFLELSALQELHQLAELRQQTMEEELSTANAKAELGKSSPLQLRVLRVTVARAKLNREKLEHQVQTARQRLAAFWGEVCPDFCALAYPFFELEECGDLCTLLEELEQHPELLRYDAEVTAAERALRLEKLEAWPDLYISGGVRQFPDERSYTFVCGIDIELPVWNGNQGNISKARRGVELVLNRKRARELELRQALIETHRSLLALQAELEALTRSILPENRRALAEMRELHELGKVDYTELFALQKLLEESQEQYLNALLLYHQRYADLDQLLARRTEGN